MPTIESLALLASSAVKLVIKLSMPEGKVFDAAADTSSKLLEGRVKDYLARRKAARLFDEIQDEISKRLERLVSIEFPDIDEATVRAIAVQLSDFVHSIDLPGMTVRSNLDGVALYGRVDFFAADLYRSLGGSATEFARFFLRELCEYIVVIADRLPDFRIGVSRELLARTDEILEDVSTVLQRVDDMRKRYDQERFSEVMAFETDYRRLLVQHLDRMHMFGLRKLNEAAREYPLTVSYISLSSSDESGRAKSVEDAVAAKRRVVVRGEAGSGKSTLLQWLAVRAASGDFGYSLHALAERMPFYIRLRDYSSASRLPAPNAFLERGWASHISSAQPQNWAHNWLKKGALILVDGFDELPIEKRKQFRDWLRSLTDSFPDSTYVVSSRPAALEADQESEAAATFLERCGFKSVAIEPLNLQDIESLVERWHLALQKDSASDETRDELLRSSAGLKRLLRERRSLRALATTPLLCAMMCALNWHLKQRLPASRMDLYQMALEMLLEQRDSEREISSGRKWTFSIQAKQAILDSMAYWMLQNGRSEVKTEEALHPIRTALKRLPQLTVPADEVFQELLERSGVLREPEHGRVDFIHRTFLEYMGARAAVEEHHLDYLARQARSDSWRETIVFASGHAKGATRDEFIGKLLPKRLSLDQSIDRKVAAACCLETAVEGLDRHVFAALKEVARGLFPPSTVEHARALAPAAELDPKLLLRAGESPQSPAVLAASIRCAALVGGVAMLEVIAELASRLPSHVPDEVKRELIRAWSAFEVEEYSAKVIRGSPWLSSLMAAYENVTKEQREETLRCLQLFSARDQFGSSSELQLSAVDAFLRDGEMRLEPGARRPMPWDPLVDGSDTALYPSAESSFSFPTTTVTSEDTSILGELQTLRRLSAVGIREKGVLESIAGWSLLEGLCISASDDDAYEALASLKELRHLHLVHCDPLRSRKPAASWLSFLAGLTKLETLWLQGLSTAADRIPYKQDSLTRIDLIDCGDDVPSAVIHAAKLQTMRVRLDQRAAKDVKIDLSKCAALESLYLQAAENRRVRLVLPHSIRRVDLARSTFEVINLAELVHLEDLRLFHMDELRDSAELLEVSSLRKIVQVMCRHPIESLVYAKLHQRGVECL